jgi:hypothetical protein
MDNQSNRGPRKAAAHPSNLNVEPAWDGVGTRHISELSNIR